MNVNDHELDPDDRPRRAALLVLVARCCKGVT